MNIIFLILTLLATCLLYLSHPHQCWLSRPLKAKPSRLFGLILLAAGLTIALYSFSTITAIFAWLTTILLSFSLLPFISLMLKRAKT